MKVLILGAILFFTACAVHVIIWKIGIPKGQTKALLRIFLAVPAVGLSALWLSPSFFANAGIPVPSTPFEYLHIILLVVSLALAYITTYSGMEVDSPSLVMTRIIADAGPAGLKEDALRETLTDDILVKPRVRDLLRDNLAYMEGDRYRVTPAGALLARIFLYYRKLLNLSVRGG